MLPVALPKQLRKIKSKQELASLVNISSRRLNSIIDNKNSYYYSYRKPKKSGGFRTITPPKDELKTIQILIKKEMDEIKWPSFVQGGIKGRSIFTNARKHLKKKMLANLDVKDFFPTTSIEMVRGCLVEAGMSVTAANVIAELCTYKCSLPQGAPTSTLLANFAFLKIDARFNRLCKKHGFQYSRYVDDVAISGDRELISFKGEFYKIIRQGSYTPAIHKTEFSGRNKPQMVNNILVNDKLRPTKKFLMSLKKEVRLCWDENLGVLLMADMMGLSVDQLRRNLWGRINFIKQFDKKKAQEIRGLMVKIRWN